MSDWEDIVFQKTFEIPLRNGLTKPSRVRGEGFRMVNMKEIFKYDRIDDSVEMEHVPVNQNEYVAFLNYNDILFARQSLVESGAGKVSIFKGKEPTVFESHLIRCRLDCKIAYPDFVYYYWKSPIGKGNISTIVTQTAAAGIKGSVLQTLPMPLPSLPEQKAIAEVLSSLDDKINLLHRQNKTLELMAETLFRKWFVEDASEEWGLGTLNDVLSVKGGTTPSTKNPDFWNGNIQWTSPRDITSLNGIYLFDTERKITEEGLKKVSSGLLPAGTLLMSSRAPVGVLAFTDIPLAINQGYIAILDNKGVSKEFIYLWLKVNMEYVQSYANGSTFLEISKSAFKSLAINIPPSILLGDFQVIVKSLFEKIKYNELQVHTLENMRDSILPKLMNGEISTSKFKPSKCSTI